MIFKEVQAKDFRLIFYRISIKQKGGKNVNRNHSKRTNTINNISS